MCNKGPPVTLCPQSYHQGGFGLLFPLFPRPQSLLRRGSPHKGHRGWVVFCWGPACSAVNSVSVTWPFWYLGRRPKTGPLLPHQLPRDRMEFPQVPEPTLSKGALISGDLHMEGHLHHWYTLLASLPFGVCPRLPGHSSFSLIRKSEAFPFAARSSWNHEAPWSHRLFHPPARAPCPNLFTLPCPRGGARCSASAPPLTPRGQSFANFPPFWELPF